MTLRAAAAADSEVRWIVCNDKVAVCDQRTRKLISSCSSSLFRSLHSSGRTGNEYTGISAF